MRSSDYREIIRDIVNECLNERYALMLRQSTPSQSSRSASRARRKAPPAWTEDQKRAIVRDCLDGMSMTQMARKYGRTVGAIRLRLYGSKAGLMNDEQAVAAALRDS